MSGPTPRFERALNRAELTRLMIVSILARDPLSCAEYHSVPSLGLGKEPLTATAFFPYRVVAHVTADSVFWLSTIPDAESGRRLHRLQVMYDRMETLMVLKGGELKEIARKGKDPLRKTVPIENQCEPA
jgi:hypothetical protein